MFAPLKRRTTKNVYDFFPAIFFVVVVVVVCVCVCSEQKNIIFDFINLIYFFFLVIRRPPQQGHRLDDLQPGLRVKIGPNAKHDTLESVKGQEQKITPWLPAMDATTGHTGVIR